MTAPRNWERGDWFISFSGEALEVRAPRPEQIHLKDIAHHLSHICRFGGAVRGFYSVASHSTYVCDLVARAWPCAARLQKMALLHDAAEAYLGDMIKPLKNVVGAPYEDLEDLWERAIAERFGLDSLKHPYIKRCDIMAVQAERRDLLPSDGGRPWAKDTDRYPPAERRVNPLSPPCARDAFEAYARGLGLA